MSNKREFTFMPSAHRLIPCLNHYLLLPNCVSFRAFYVLIMHHIVTFFSKWIKRTLNILNDNRSRTIFNFIYCQGVHKCHFTLNFLWRPADYTQKIWYMETTWNVLIFLDNFFFLILSAASSHDLLLISSQSFKEFYITTQGKIGRYFIDKN